MAGTEEPFVNCSEAQYSWRAAQYGKGSQTPSVCELVLEAMHVDNESVSSYPGEHLTRTWSPTRPDGKVLAAFSTTTPGQNASTWEQLTVTKECKNPFAEKDQLPDEPAGMQTIDPSKYPKPASQTISATAPMRPPDMFAAPCSTTSWPQ